MRRRRTFNTPGHAHCLTFSCWQRRPFLCDREACRIFPQSLEEARAHERFAIWAYVLMPEHVHLLIRPLSESYAMAMILRRMKEPAARRVLTI